LLRRSGITARSADVALVAPAYNLRALRLPDVPTREQRVLVRGELEEIGALSPGGGTFDHIWAPIPAESGVRRADVYAYYTDDRSVEAVVEALRQAGLRLDRLEPASLAMIRACIAAGPRERAMAFLCPSAKHSDLCLYDGRRIRQLRRIAGGWADVAPSTAPTLPNFDADGNAEFAGPQEAQGGAPPVAGETTWLTAGTWPLDRPGTTASAGAAEGSADRTSSAAFLASEIARSLAFNAREDPDAPRPEALAVVAGDPEVREFRDAIAAFLPLPVADPPATLFGLAWEEALPGWGAHLAAAGVGMPGADPGFPQLDISRQESVARRRRRAPTILLAGMSAATIWVLLSAAAAILLPVFESLARSKDDQLDRQLEALKRERAPLVRAQDIAAATRAAMARDAVPVAPILGRVAASATPGVALTGLHMQGDGKVAVEGDARDSAQMKRFAYLLGQGRAVEAPSFEMMRQDAAGGLKFRIVGSFTRGAGPAPAQTAEK
jgi:Tfp pilus assembly protein PilN